MTYYQEGNRKMTDNPTIGPRELLALPDAEIRARLEAMLPKPTYPEHLLGVWAKHPEYGDVACVWDRPDSDGNVLVRWREERKECGSNSGFIPVSKLKFPHQTTRPEDVPVGEAWLVNVEGAKRSGERVVALKFDDNEWGTGEGVVVDSRWWLDAQVTLVAPLTPQPAPEPQPEQKHPRTLSSVEDYETAPEGTVVAAFGNNPWVKVYGGGWKTYWTGSCVIDADMSDLEEQAVLRWGWG